MNTVVFMQPDANGKPIQGALSGPTLAATYDATISSATTVTFNANTSIIVVSAIDKGIFVRFDATVTSSAFDEFVPLNTKVYLVRPVGSAFMTVIEEAATAKIVVIEK